jgi:phosphoribosylanthranilate isomerase
MTSPADALAAAEAGADEIGIILHASARRRVDIATARLVVDALPSAVAPVGVFVDAPAEVVLRMAAELGLKKVQFHGHETPADVAAVAPLEVVKAVKMFHASAEADLALWAKACAAGECPNLVGILLEAPTVESGGTGVVNDFPFVEKLQRSGTFAKLPPIVVSGGLSPDNVAAVVRLLRPSAVDVSSGIESTYGRKSREKMNDFVASVRAADDLLR